MTRLFSCNICCSKEHPVSYLCLWLSVSLVHVDPLSVSLVHVDPLSVSGLSKVTLQPWNTFTFIFHIFPIILSFSWPLLPPICPRTHPQGLHYPPLVRDPNDLPGRSPPPQKSEFLEYFWISSANTYPIWALF